MAFIIIPALLIYIGVCSWFIAKQYLPRWYPALVPDSGAKPVMKLARDTSRILSLIHGVSLFLVLAWPTAWALMGIGHYGNPDWGTDVKVFTGFNIDLAQLPSIDVSGLRDPVIHGETSLSIDTTSFMAWNLFALATELKGILLVFLVLQMRNLFVAISNGETFSRANGRRLKRCGTVVLLTVFLAPLFQYFGWGMVIHDIGFNNNAISLFPSYRIGFVNILVGVSLLVFAGVMGEAARLQDEQRLTI